MLVTIDTDQLVRDAATIQMDNKYMAEWACVVKALQNQMPDEFEFNLSAQVRQQVKEYKKLTMWRD
jgi:hypothetical protein